MNRKDKIDFYQEYDRVRGKDTTSERYKKQLAQQPEKRKLYKEKYHARLAIASAVSSGKMIKPVVCEACGCSDKRIEAHHCSYAEDMQLLVTWLCTSCHGKVHRKYD